MKLLQMIRLQLAGAGSAMVRHITCAACDVVAAGSFTEHEVALPVLLQPGQFIKPTTIVGFIHAMLCWQHGSL